MDSASNRLLLDDQDDNGIPTTRTLGYDASGNTDTDVRHDGSNRTLTHDVRGRLSQVADSGGTIATYSYNALGQRVRKQVGGMMGTTAYFIYELNGELLAEHDGGGNVIREYHRVEGELMGMSVGTSVYAVYTDHLGTPQVVADASAVHVWEAMYEPFGAVELVVNTVDMPLRFPGQYFDDETGHHYNYFRD